MYHLGCRHQETLVTIFLKKFALFAQDRVLFDPLFDPNHALNHQESEQPNSEIIIINCSKTYGWVEQISSCLLCT